MSGLADTDKPEEWFRHHVYSNTEEESVSWSKLMRGGFGSVFSVSLCVFFSLLALAGTLLLDIILGYNSVIHWLALGGIEGLSTLFWIAFIRVKRQKVLWCFCACSLYSIILLGGAVITTIAFIVVYPWLDDFSQSMCDTCENPARIGGGSRPIPTIGCEDACEMAAVLTTYNSWLTARLFLTLVQLGCFCCTFPNGCRIYSRMSRDEETRRRAEAYEIDKTVAYFKALAEMNITTEEDEEGDEKAQAEKGDNVGESGLRRRRSSIAKAAAQQFRRRWNLGDESGVKSNRPSFRRIDEVSDAEDDEMRVITFSD